MAGPKPMQTEFGIHHILESCDAPQFFKVISLVLSKFNPMRKSNIELFAEGLSSCSKRLLNRSFTYVPTADRHRHNILNKSTKIDVEILVYVRITVGIF